MRCAYCLKTRLHTHTHTHIISVFRVCNVFACIACHVRILCGPRLNGTGETRHAKCTFEKTDTTTDVKGEIDRKNCKNY